ncbi:MAG: ABC transporter permease [Synergistaceae bacterium]|jgi:ribose/xylose/arabinose/galactoside ABC-type transport system permease subunit|nr:ABC transporter permease [Synergistaceae bacterium]
MTPSNKSKMSLNKDNQLAAMLKKIVMPLLLLALIVLFSFTSRGTFFTWYNFKNMLSQSSYVIIAAVGLTSIMLAGGIDLSIGYQMSLTGVSCGMLMIKSGLPPTAAIPITLLIGILLGLVNGIVCVKLGVFPLIVTLSSSMVFQGISYMISGSKTYLGFSKEFLFIGQGFIGPIPFNIFISAAVVVIMAFVLQKTYFGRYVYAIGGNEEAAKLSGINTDKIKIILYTFCGFCSALASIVLISRSGAAAATIGPGTEFTALSGAILGGVTLAGGEGSVVTMVVGAFIITILGNGMQLMRLGTFPQYIAKGVVLIAAMAFDSYQKKRKEVKKKDAAA